MQPFLETAHELWRWVVVAGLLVAAVAGLAGYARRTEWGSRMTQVTRFMSIAYDIQVLLGVALYIVEQMWKSTDPFFRSIHPATMLVGLIVVHVAVRRTRTGATSRSRHMWLAGGAITTLLVVAVGAAVR